MASAASNSSTISPCGDGIATPNDKINFYKACRVLLDNVPKALRLECKQELNTCSKLKLPKSPDEKFKISKSPSDLDFSRLAECLVSSKRTKEGSVDHYGSYYFHGFSAKRDASKIPDKDCVYLVVDGKECEEFVKHYGDCETMTCSISGEFAKIKKIDCNGRYLVNRSLPKPANNKPQIFQVYFQTSKCAAIYKLKEFRNENIGHAKGISITDDKLKQLFEDVREVYRLLGGAHDVTDIMEELEKIEREVVAEESIVEELEEYRRRIEQDEAEMKERLTLVERRQDDLEGSHEKLKENFKLFKKEGAAIVDQVYSNMDSIDSRVQKLEEEKGNQDPQQVVTLPGGMTITTPTSHGIQLMSSISTSRQNGGVADQIACRSTSGQIVGGASQIVGGATLVLGGRTLLPNLDGRQYSHQSSSNSSMIPQSPPQLLSGPPGDDEICELAQKLADHYNNSCMFTPPWDELKLLCKALELDHSVIKEIGDDCEQSLKEKIITALNVWVNGNHSNDRTKLKQILGNVRLSSFTKYIK